MREQPGGGGTTRGTVETEPDWRSRTARPVGDGPEWAAWSWSGGGRPFSWLGVFLVLIGAALLVQRLQPAISLTSLLLLALGLAFGAAWLLGGARWASVPAAALLALAAARLGGELGILRGGGWGTLFLGLGFVVAWAVGRVQGTRRDWALWLGLIIGLIGATQIGARLAGLPDLGLLWPLLIIVVGGALLLRARSDGRQRSSGPR